MQNTPNYDLKKPDYTDFADVMDLNDDMDIIDETLADKLDKTGDASNAKVATATNSSASYPIPAANDTFKVILGKIIKFFTDIKAAFVDASVNGTTITLTKANGMTKTLTTQDTTYSSRSASSNGLMAASDYRNLYNRDTNGDPVTDNANCFWSTTSAGVYGWRNDVLASASRNGLMSIADKTKIDNIAAGATVSGVADIQAGTKSGLASSTSTITQVAFYRASVPGTYLVMMTASTASSASSGYLRCVVNTEQAWGASPSNANMSGTGAFVSSFYVYTINENTVFRALVQQSSGAAQDVRWNFTVIRLS